MPPAEPDQTNKEPLSGPPKSTIVPLSTLAFGAEILQELPGDLPAERWCARSLRVLDRARAQGALRRKGPKGAEGVWDSTSGRRIPLDEVSEKAGWTRTDLSARERASWMIDLALSSRGSSPSHSLQGKVRRVRVSETTETEGQGDNAPLIDTLWTSTSTVCLVEALAGHRRDHLQVTVWARPEPQEVSSLFIVESEAQDPVSSRRLGCLSSRL